MASINPFFPHSLRFVCSSEFIEDLPFGPFGGVGEDTKLGGGFLLQRLREVAASLASATGKRYAPLLADRLGAL